MKMHAVIMDKNDRHSAILGLAGLFNAYFRFLTGFFGNQKIIRDLNKI
jgi:hypothetical protein